MKHPLSTAALVAWLEKKPAESKYDYTHCYGCCLFQYLQSMGLPVRAVVPFEWKDANGQTHPLPQGWNYVAQGEAVAHAWGKRTWGGALERARDLLAKEQNRQEFREKPKVQDNVLAFRQRVAA